MEHSTTLENETTVITTSNDERFVRFQYRLLAATDYVSPVTGANVPLTPTVKVIYMLMKERFDFFSSSKSDYYDSQQMIAEACGVSKQTVHRAIKQLTTDGVIRSHTKLFNGNTKLVYNYIAPLKLVLSKEINNFYLDSKLFEDQHEPKPKTATKQPAKAPAKPLSLVPASKPSTPTAPTVAAPVEPPVDDVPPSSDYDDYNICYEQEEQLPAVRRTKSSHSVPKNTEGHKVERKVVRTEDGSIF